ncbi:T9SS type A sorting domain-containing protein [Tunicatimonas pelagia]|uniref:T9SS type A sorting domain-containing protein n=1 Tax=Tunicatimonas pelagia TaxID=931531 RepID=UPI002665BF86|nr:T9SS type A sorting domain-containing protein [Tunicatimonas pelagia]WKN46314.1 T9SS type A sorting domain-containing protein [Tunicatimonas pelagia]
MKKSILLGYVLLVHMLAYVYAEGSKNLTPNNTGSTSGSNQFIGYLQHDDGDNSGDFFKPGASDTERVYIYISNGETLYYGFRRRQTNENDNLGTADPDIFGDLVVTIRDNAGNIVQRDTIFADRTSPRNRLFRTAQDGVIESYAQAAAGPSAVVGASGYRAISYTNNTGLSEDFYVEVYQIDVNDPTTEITEKSWYDLWDFSVFDGSEERPGRIHAKSWSFSAGTGNARLSTEFQMFSLIEGVGPDGYYVKEIDLQQIQPFGMLVYSNSTGADPTLAGTTDFLELRRSQTTNVASAEYYLFINNPDINVYPTATLPTVSISDFNTVCNADGSASAVVTFNSNRAGTIALLIDVNGTPGFQDGTTDVILEARTAANTSQSLRWNGLDGLGAVVPSGTNLSITGRYTAGPVHVPLWDVENNSVGINILDVRPATTFDQIFWDDSNLTRTSFTPETELNGTNTEPHDWSNNHGDRRLVNTWSYGYLELNSQTVTFTYNCDTDGDGVANNTDLDSDNDGIPDATEGDPKTDSDSDGIADYLDADFADFTDANGDGVNDNFDADRDGIPNAYDLDSDNDGIPDIIEAGGTDTSADGRVDSFVDTDNNNGYADALETTPLPIHNTDQDGVADYLDIDSDNDGIVDVIEAGGSASASGTIASFTDSNENGWNDDEEIFPLSVNDTDGDGTLPNYRDIDSDNDGIPDNQEAQNSQSYVAPGAATDTDGDGLINTYDPDQGGTLLSPINTDNIGDPDYVDNDADGDGVGDVIEGFDTDSDGFGDWDTDSDNDITDETGYNTDADGDGLWDVFDTEAGGAAAGIGNTTASNASLQNTDRADNADWQDTDDDNDGILTAGEDDNEDGNWANDRTQGQSGASSPPDYLFYGDYDGDGVTDANDLDSDNDGILDTDEDGGTGVDPSADADSDGVANYEDADLAGFVDANGDGVNDNFDADQDGIPNFLDADSDNDGLYDTYEANNGSAIAGFDSNTGQFTLDDPDNDGLMNQVDNNVTNSGGVSRLPNADFDGDGFEDFIDLDSDNDGIPDNIEVQAEGSYVAATTTDVDGDGLFDVYDPDQGGTLLFPVNTDGADEPDYRDTDSDNDNIIDRVEGHDANNDGFGDWDTDSDNDFTDETGFGTDSDNDGILDIFDNVATVSDVTNITGSSASLQNTDGLDNRNWRDNNDDNDAFLTADEDANLNGDYTDDQTQGQSGGSAVPDYLFKGDTDSDGVIDANDTDSDNDGIPDTAEAGTTGVDPSADADSDGIPNYRDSDVAGFVDSNGDGVDDRGDKDLDGIPNFQDLDSDNDGIPDAVEANNGVLPNNMNQNGQFPATYVNANDADNDGFPLDVDPDESGTALANPDHDGDGLSDALDLDSDNDGLPDLVEGGGTDTNGDGRIDNFVDADNDGLASVVDSSEGGTAFLYPDSDGDTFRDYFDVDSDNDGIADTTEEGGRDTDANGVIDGFTDTDNDGLADEVDSDNGGTAFSFNDQDGDGLNNYRDLDSDNDGLPDIIEGGGTDADANGRVDTFADANDNGYADALESAPLPVTDTDNDGLADFNDIDSDNDGIVDVIEISQTADANGRISGFTDANSNGLNDAQEGSAISPVNTDSDGLADYLDLDADNDGITDKVESQTKATFVALTNLDSDNDGLDDAYDPDQGGILISPVNTDGTGNPDYQDTDSDDDTIPDLIEGHDADKDGFGDWDSDEDGVFTDEAGHNADLDDDGILDIFDTFGGVGNQNVIATNTALQDTDNDNIYDFQDTDDDGDGVNTGDGTGGTEDDSFTDDPNGNTPNYLYDTNDEDGDTIANEADLDSDNDGILDTDEDGGTGIDPSADADGDNLPNFEDPNISGYTDTNGDGVDDRFDHDLDGVPDFLDLDSDNDGIPDAIEANIGIVPPTGYTANNARFDPANDGDGDGLADAVDGGTTSTLANPDSDSDGLNDVLDIDSDNDGLVDNREAQVATAYIAPIAGDTDNDGLLDVYDGNNGGTALTPTDSDASLPDYIDPDSDGDGLADIIEGHDANSNGFADWDTDGDNSITDEVGNNADADGDGLWNIFDTNSGSGIANSTATNADYQDTDGDNVPDYQDSDDDGDGVATSAEDTNSNSQFNDDFSQGGGTIPNYLFAPDRDGDNVLDNVDADSDNDGVPNTTEYTGAVYASGGSPFDDADGDGIYNYLDTNDTNNTSFTDANGDGVDDQVDQDRDGVPNFFDLDSDNDGILDAIEANGGTVPTGFSTTTGRFTSTTDGDGDGLVNTVDSNDGDAGVTSSTLAIPNFDGDGLADYLDLDTDDDGIPDNREAQSESYTAISDNDTDGDGLDDAYDGNNGGTAIIPENTDTTDEPDYRDLDSDNDLVGDRVEGYDANRNGFADWDTGQDNNIFTEETGHNTDSDDDGIRDLFDNYAGFSRNNIIGVSAPLQDTDGNGTRDFRDTDDDGDGVATAAEDINGNGILYDDKNQAGGASPDYLFFADLDNDGVADNVDFDSDNDGIPTTDEVGALPNPYNDSDADGTPNFMDTDAPGFVDTNSDGIDDRYDFDLDGRADFLDLDMDNDGIPDAVEANGGTPRPGVDADGQYSTAYIAANDSNNNGLVDDLETGQGGTPLALSDTDNDGKADYRDLDSDNDGIPDIIEGGGVDTNNDGTIDAFSDTDGDGLANTVDSDHGGTAYTIANTDGDALPDYRDADSDNDGLSDLNEAGGTDATNNGRADDITDIDGDGWVNTFDSDNGGSALAYTDTDNDGNENYRDLDSDNDGIPDAIERNGGSRPINMNGNGQYATFNDSDSDGLANDTDGTTPTVTSTDGDGIPDYLDLDSDSDGIPDILEVNGTDNNNDGRVDNFVDTDNDGLADALDSDNSGTALTIANSDGDGNLPDYRDRDSDNDGIPDIIEVNGTDADNDGLPANSTTDSDGDGWANSFDSNNGGTALTVRDIDGDGKFNFQDLDSDNDGLSDIIEANGTDADNDGLPASVVDTDGDGWPDTFDSNDGGIAYTYVDTDGDNRYNFADLDSDNDGIPDAVEANGGTLPANMNSDGQYSTFNDTDDDGYANDRDSDNGGTAYSLPNSDGDAVADYLDLDSDNDGIPDAVEANQGSLPTNMNSSGQYSTFVDSDFDGLADALDSDNGGTALANPNTDNGLSGGDGLADYIDRDADADGIVDIVEAGGTDTDHDGVVDSFADADGDGLANTVDGSPLAYTDTDLDGTPNYIDTDSDNDTVSDLIEAFDSNSNATTGGGTADGVAGVTPSGTDANGDGIDDNFAGAIPTFQNTDGSGPVDWLDNDDDGDGIATADENADINPTNGIPDYLEPTDNPCGGRSVQAYLTTSDITDSDGDVPDANNAAGEPDGNIASIRQDGDEIEVDLRHFLTAGDGTYIVTWKRRGGAGTANLIVEESVDGITFTRRTSLPSSTSNTVFTTSVLTAEVNTRYLRFLRIQGQGRAYEIDAVGTCSPDRDSDLVADRIDEDDDDDGIPDAVEIAGFANDPSGDDDVDGELNYEDADIAGFVDTNSDGINDNFDQDLDGVPNHLDLDADNDGIPDAVEANNGSLPANMTANGRYTAAYLVSNDNDDDGLADDVDTDDGGTVLDNPNTDGQGNTDFLDLDSDNDGIPDVVEAGGTDANNDGRLDSTTDGDGDGLANTVDSDEGGTALTIADLDSDGLANYRDVDSDNDGIPDLVEAGGTDNGDGVADTATDTDGDGWADTFDSDNGGTALSVTDTDGDGNLDQVDLDSDNDGIPDAVEANGGTLPANMDSDGQYSAAYTTANDIDTDGLVNDVDTNNGGSALAIPNTDGIGSADYLDIDSDNDGIPDLVEAGGTDANNDGRIDTSTDTDGDGIVDALDPDNGGAALTIGDPDGDGVVTYRDLDSDNDGIPDVVEMGGTDANGDGRTDNPSDNDGDGWSNTYDSNNGGTAFAQYDTDGDGLNNNVDLDTDSDGIADAYEANGGDLPANMEADGQYPSAYALANDGDNDGLVNNVDTNNGGTALPVANTDGTGGADFADNEADADGIADYIEAFDDDENGVAANDFISRAAAYESANSTPGHYPATDSDTNGIPDWLEDSDADGTPNYLDFGNAFYRDSDSDGLVDLHDPDQNGQAYAAVSGQPDADNDGAPNQYDADDEVALPVELLFFKGKPQGNSVLLEWSTATETNNDRFEIEHSTDGVIFSRVGIVAGQGTTVAQQQYEFVHTHPAQGINYYRLKQVDFDGASSYSKVISVSWEMSQVGVQVYPNPADREMSVRLSERSTSEGALGVKIQIVDVQGSTILNYYSESKDPHGIMTIDTSLIPNGSYYLQVSHNGKVTWLKIFISH